MNNYLIIVLAILVVLIGNEACGRDEGGREEEKGRVYQEVS